MKNDLDKVVPPIRAIAVAAGILEGCTVVSSELQSRSSGLPVRMEYDEDRSRRGPINTGYCDQVSRRVCPLKSSRGLLTAPVSDLTCDWRGATVISFSPSSEVRSNRK
jgi:hypothetical protein